ncbi:MAG: DUF456 domain-containing protein [bacterium]|nr:DUF456 domain-containing protein [bacterium]
MLAALGLAAFFAVQVLGLLLIPLGLPGIWLQVAACAGVVLASDGVRLGWGWVATFAGLAVVGEVVEFLLGQWGARRFGGSHAAGWGALVGGIVGAFVGGIPIPVLGAVVMSFVDTFAGAIAGEMWARRHGAPDLRIGVGAVLGRAVGVATKLALALVILILSAAALLFETGPGPQASGAGHSITQAIVPRQQVRQWPSGIAVCQQPMPPGWSGAPVPARRSAGRSPIRPEGSGETTLWVLGSPSAGRWKCTSSLAPRV